MNCDMFLLISNKFEVIVYLFFTLAVTLNINFNVAGVYKFICL